MGARFRIPMAFFEGLDTGDGRSFRLGQWITRELPLTLQTLFAEPDMGGHGGAIAAGRIDSMHRVDVTTAVDGATGRTWGDLAGGQVWAWAAEGELADTPDGDRTEELVRSQVLRGVSADLAEVTWEEEVIAVDEDGWPTEIKLVGGPGMIGGLTVVNLPAFRGATIELLDEAGQPVQLAASAGPAGQTPWLPAARESDPGCLPCRTGTVTAAGGPLDPPAGWFAAPALDGPTPLTVDDDGRVYGHLAIWGTCHTGFQGQCVTPPRSLTAYALFRTGAVRTREGSDVPVGHITLGTGHADLHAGAAAAASHYDDTGAVVADIAAGDDEHGIWVAGALRPDVDDLQLRQLRAAPLSGDWRRHGSGLELVAALAVNTPGFPVVRSLAAAGVPQALVAAGARAVAVAASRDVDLDTRSVLSALQHELLHLRRDRALRRLRNG